MARVITTVARAFGRPLHEVARESFALTLWAWHWEAALAAEDRMSARFDRLDAASLNGIAFTDPGKLRQVEASLLSDAGLLGGILRESRSRAMERLGRIARAKPAPDPE